MANIYVRSTDGSDADNGSTWALAKATLTGAAAIDAAGDTIFVSDNHAESTAGAVTLNFAGTLASPVRVLCGDDAAEPPTALATTGTVTTTGSNAININGAAYVYGLAFISGTSIVWNNSGSVPQHYKNCSFQTTNTGSAGFFQPTQNNTTVLTLLEDCTFKFNATSNKINTGGRLIIRGGSVLSGGSTPSSLFALPTDRAVGDILVEGFDFSNLASTFNIFGTGAVSTCRGVVRNCKLPASWSGSLAASGTPQAPGQRYEMYNCDDGATNYRLWIADYAGSVKHTTAVYNDAGATDGTQRISWAMATGANAEYPLIVLESPEIVKWNNTTGSSVTATVEIVHDGATAFKDDEIWLEVQYLSSSGTPLGAFVSDCKADVLATAATQATSTATWTGDTGTGPNGSSTWNTLKLSVSFTPQMKGFVHAVVKMAVASKTAYVDPLLTLS